MKALRESWWMAGAVALLMVVGCAQKETTTTQTTNLDLKNMVEIKTALLPDGTEGVAYSESFAVVGGDGTYTWSLEAGGTNDAWLSLDAAGTLSGTPTLNDVGYVQVIIKVADTLDPLNFDVQAFDFYVDATPASVRILTTTLPNAWVNNTWNPNLQAEGGSGNYIWTKLPTGTNDAWVTVYSYGSTYGYPSSFYIGDVTLRIRVTDANDTTKRASASFTFKVYPNVITITNPTPLPSASISSAYSVTMTATGGSGGYLWALEPGGTNDTWLSMSSTTGMLSGTAPGSAQVVSFTISCTDLEKPSITVTKAFSMTVKTLAIQTERIPAGFVGIAYSQSLSASGGTPPYTWSIEPGGTNYSWLSMASGSLQNATGPTSTNLGAVKVIVKATDGTNSDSRLYQTTVYNPLSISSNSMADARVGTAYSQLVPVTGGTGSFTFSKEAGGTNDGWLTINTTTGRLTGTPTSANLGTCQVVVKVVEKDYASVYDTETITIQVKGVTIMTSSVPDPNLNVAFTYGLAAVGGSGYYAWSASTIPSWMSINPDTGQLTGTPTTTGSFTLVVTAYDPLDPVLTDTKTYTFWVVSYLLSEDFTTSPAGWAAYSGWYLQRSHVAYYSGPDTAFNGSYSMGSYWYGNYYTSRTWSTYYGRSPLLNLPSMSNIYLTFWMYLQTDTGDGMQVEASTDGSTWTQLTPTYPVYNGTAGGVAAWSDYNQNGYNKGWIKCQFDLTSWAGNNIYLRWSMYTTDGDSISGPGFAIDEVRVFSLSATGLLPKPVSYPVPFDGITFAPPESSDFTSGVNLSWDPGLAASSYDVYLGTSQSAVNSATTASAEFMGNQTAISYSATTLSSGNTYYWRVDSRNSAGTAKGIVWSFTTASPLKILINEIQMYGYSYGPYVEIYNPSTSVYQEVTGWDLNFTYTPVSGTAQTQTYVLPNRMLLGPGACRVFAWYNGYQQYTSPYVIYNTVYMPNMMMWYYANYEAEAWLRNPSAVGQDYWGVNITTSNRPSDLNWTNPITQTSSYYSIWRRTSNTDNDSGADFRNDYYYYYWMPYGQYGLKDYGQ